jgi:UDP-N-acetyl-D-mannosaminuronic acid transferase (WecB/TagA/CpsF family)
MAELDRKTVQVLGVPVDSISWLDAITRVIDWAIDRSSRMVAICNVHVVVMASRNVEYGEKLLHLLI